jgi:hypothetical protein
MSMSVPHGTTQGYRSHGCRCDACSEASYLATKSLTLARQRGDMSRSLVDAEPARKHLLWLRDDLKVSEKRIAEAAGISTSTLQAVLRCNTRAHQTERRARILGATAARILAVQPPSVMVSMEASIIRVQALNALGYRQADIMALMTRKIANLNVNRGRRGATITREKAQDILDVCLRVGDRPGPNPLTAKRCRTKGFRVPADYDEDLFYDIEWDGVEPEREAEDRAAALLEDAAEIERTLREPSNQEEARLNRELLEERLGVTWDYVISLRRRQRRAA